MTIDFCKPWSDEECRLFLDAIKKRKTEYCEKCGLPVPAFDKMEDFYVEAGMMPGYEADRSGEADMLRKEENFPLTLEELREMDGEPVWCKECKCYGIVSVDVAGIWEGTPFFLSSKSGTVLNYNVADRKLTLYRHKPEEAT